MIGDRHIPRPSVPHYTMKGGSHYVFGKKTSEEIVEGGGYNLQTKIIFNTDSVLDLRI